SVAVWCKVQGGQGTNRSVLTCRNASGAPVVTSGYELRASVSNRWEFLVGSGATNFITVSGPAVATNQWVHLVGTYDGNTAQLFVNGATAGYLDSAFVTNSSRPLRIGAGNTEGAT